MDLLDRVLQFRAGGLLEEIAARSGVERLLDVLEGGEHRQNEHARLGRARMELAHRLHAVQLGHGDVHDDDIGPQLACQTQRLAAVGGGAGDLDALIAAQERGKPVADHGVVVRDQHPNLHRFLPTAAITRVPRPWADSISSRPPTSSMRSRIVCSPNPLPCLSAAMPRPSSETESRASPPSSSSSIVTVSAPACFAALASASWATRNNARSVARGSRGENSGPSTSTANPYRSLASSA